MWKTLSTASSASSVLTAEPASTPSPMTRKIARLMPSAGPAVQNMFRMLAGGQAADQLRHQDRRLRERRHLSPKYARR